MTRITRKPKGSYHHGNLREAIVAASARVVADEGSASLTIRRVADRLGVTHAAIYHHFEDRTAMLVAVAEQALHRLADSMSRSSSLEAQQHLRALGVAYVTFAFEHPRLYAAMSGPDLVPPTRHAGLAAARARVFDHIREAIIACQRDGFVRPGSPDEHTLFCWSAVHGLATLVSEGQTTELDLPTDATLLGDIVLDRVFLGLASNRTGE